MKNVLITGGAGFIGSNLVAAFLADSRINKVRVLDNLSNGYIENLDEFRDNDDFEFIEGDIRDYQTCVEALERIDIISHQAALGSVPRSIKDPKTSTEVNILGTVNLLQAAVECGVKRIVLAFSSSTYGDHPGLPKEEDKIGNPLSPYAVTKAAIEQFCQVFGNTYDIEWIGLRYFNVFGPKQNPNNPYAAVIPIFSKAFLDGGKITVNGDGETSRDFTFVDNVVEMNKLAMFTSNSDALNQIYNTACNERVSLNQMIAKLAEITGNKISVNYGPERTGDVKHSLASIQKANNLLGYKPLVYFNDGLEKVVDWYRENL
ncbi:SDR family oxidoreductase [Schleiferiaceae bacterium]|nr:SDR family oxidoreductase [Schleiferiaceae bacterium]